LTVRGWNVKPAGDVEPLRAQLDGHGEAGALRGRLGDRDRGVGILEQRRSGARLADLRDRAAHVEVDQVGARLGHARGRRAHDVGVLAEQLHRHRPALALARVDHQQLVERLAVLVVDREARDHLGERQARAVALGLQAHEPVADPRQRREHDAVGDGQSPELPRIGQRSHAF
jgi:hypothetical protein